MTTTTGEIVTEVALLTAAEVERVRRDVHADRSHWTPRNPEAPFYTLGAASYLDARNGRFAVYQQLAQRLNPLLAGHFGWLHERLRDAVSAIVGTEVHYDDRLALPGFHIFLHDPERRHGTASLHYDLQYELIDWNGLGAPDTASQLSLTLAIALPASGGGLLVWNINRLDIMQMTPDERIAHTSANRFAAKHPYTAGHLVVHSGHQLHQMAGADDPQPGDERMTVQAHALPVGGRWVMYW